MSSKVCATCIYAGGFSIGPGISGADEGVKCSNSEFARYLDRLQKSDSYEKEYNRQGYINIFRVEAVTAGKEEQCQFWSGKKSGRKSGKK